MHLQRSDSIAIDQIKPYRWATYDEHTSIMSDLYGQFAKPSDLEGATLTVAETLGPGRGHDLLIRADFGADWPVGYFLADLIV